MKKLFFVSLWAVLIAPNCFGQYGVAQAWGTERGLHGTTQAMTNNNFMENLPSNFGPNGEATSAIKGTIYLNDNFTLGTLYVNDEEIRKMYMRYDAYNDQIELKNSLDSDEVKAMVKHPVYSCSMDGDEYYYLGYTDEDGSQKKGYLVPMVIGDGYTLFVKHKKIYKKGKEASTSLDASFPPSFTDNTEYYVSQEGKAPIFMRTRKNDVLSIFMQDDIKAIKDYMKDKRPNVKNDNDLLNLFTYANTLK